MNINAVDSLKAKREYTLRPYKHFGIGIAVFAPICFGLMLMPHFNPLLAAAIAVVPAFCIYYWLESRLIVIECPKCGKDVNSNTPWECGFNGCRNENADTFSFLNECGVCHFVPKAYECHHCGSPIYLTSDRHPAHAAKRLDAPKPVPPPPVNPNVTKAARQAAEIQDAKHALALATYAKETEIIKNKPATPPPATPELQRMIDRVRKEVENGKTLIKLERELLDEAQKEAAGDEEKFSELERNVLIVIHRQRERMERGSQELN